jgi:hypothetical protein
MRAFIALFCLALPGCPAEPDGPGPHDDTGAETGETTDELPPLIPDGERILLYHGHGGPDDDESGWARFDRVDTHWKDQYGWNSDYRDYIPEDLSDYRAIFFLGPGYSTAASFDPADLERLRAANQVGTRMIVLTEKDGCASPTASELLEGLGSTMRFSGSGLGAYQIAEIELISPHQITEGISALRFRDACYLDVGEGLGLARFNDEQLVGVERIGTGGEVVLIGDFEFMDDSGPRDWADNALLADRLVEIDPALAR